MSTKPTSAEAAATVEDDYVLLSSEMEPDNELFKLDHQQAPLNLPETEFLQMLTLATCFSTTDLKAKFKNLPHIIETFHKNFKQLKVEAKNDSDRIQNEIFELYNSFFVLLKSILTSLDESGRVLLSTEQSLKALRKEIELDQTQQQQQENQLQANKTVILIELEMNASKFLSLYSSVNVQQSCLGKMGANDSKLELVYFENLTD
jgi:hypothetical protein